MNLVLRIDADQRIGFGHAVRASALASALSPTRVTVCGSVDAGRLDLLPSAAIVSAPADPVECARTIRALMPDLVICDLPQAPPHMWFSLRQILKSPVVAIDDFGGDVDADLIVNGTVLPAYHHYNALSASAKVLCGGRYALLRAPFRQRHWSDPEVSRLTLVVGSGLRAADWLATLIACDFFATVPALICVVVGWGFARPELLDRVRGAGVRLEVGLDAEGLAEHLVTSSLVLCTGGMIVYEALAVGVPAIVYPQEDNCVEEVRWFAARGALVDLGPGNHTAPDKVAGKVTKLLSNRARGRELSRRGLAIVDGGGASRVAAYIRSHISRSSTCL